MAALQKQLKHQSDLIARAAPARNTANAKTTAALQVLRHDVSAIQEEERQPSGLLTGRMRLREFRHGSVPTRG